MRTPLSMMLAGAVLLFSSSALFAHGDEGDRHGRASKLTPPAGAANQDARGIVVLTSTCLTVKVEGLAAGEYSVLLDDGTGTKSEIGKITVAAEADDDNDEAVAGGGDHGDDGDAEDEGDEAAETEGSLMLCGDKLPAGDLHGRDIVVNDSTGATVLAGKTPAVIPPSPDQRSGKCGLSRPDPAVDADAEGFLKIESGDGRVVIKVHLAGLTPGKVYEIFFTKPDDSATESAGKVTIGDDGEGHFKLDSAKGDTIPFGAGDLAALKGYKVSVKDDTGAVVLLGTVCDAPIHHDDDEGDEDHEGDHEGDHGEKLCAKLDGAQEVPPVDTTATAKAEFEFGGADGLTLEYEVEDAQGLSGPATALTINSGAAGASGAVLVTLDATALKGEVAVTADQKTEILSGNTYVNLATAAHADGEIRGQIGACVHDGEEDEGDEEHEGDDDAAPPPPPAGGGGELIVSEPMFVMVGNFDTPFLRGDSNGDGVVDVSDIVTTLTYLFQGGARPYCLDAADDNDDGGVDVSDAIAGIFFLYQNGGSLPEPGALIPGSDPTADNLYCQESP
jgi:CHRD domain-containing protein